MGLQYARQSIKVLKLLGKRGKTQSFYTVPSESDSSVGINFPKLSLA